MATWQTIFDNGFSSVGTWRRFQPPAATPPVDIGPIIIGLDGSFTCAVAQTWTITEAQTNIPYDPASLYRVRFRGRTASLPAADGNCYFGFTGVQADGTTRINIDGTPNSIDNQHYAALRNVLPPSTATDYFGYMQGLATPGSSGPNNSIATPGKMRTGTAFIRPLMVLMSNANEGQQFVYSCTVDQLVNAANMTVLRTADGTRIATTEIQQWPERSRDRDASILRIAGAGDPVVIWDALSSATGTITFLTRTVADRTALVNVLTANQKLVMTAPCEGVSFGAPVNFYLLRLRERRLTNNGTDVRRLFDVDIQEVSA